jgi:hypothetical protein
MALGVLMASLFGSVGAKNELAVLIDRSDELVEQRRLGFSRS